MVYLIIWLCFGFATAHVATQRGGSTFGWLIGGFLFGPLAFVLAFTCGVECPHCKKLIHPKATRCPHCQMVPQIDEPEDAVDKWKREHPAGHHA